MSTLAGLAFGVLGVFGVVTSALLLLLVILRGLFLTGVRAFEVDGNSMFRSFRLEALVILETSSSRVWLDTVNSSSMRLSFWTLALLSDASSESFLFTGCGPVIIKISMVSRKG